MHLLSLQIQNFRVIRRAVLPLPDHVIGVIGPNGAGKSSLVEAVAWALYGNPAARSGKDEIKSQFAGVDDNCEVILQFEVKNIPYRVVRRLVGRTERAEVELYRGERSESVGVSETQAYISRLLGLDLKGFLTSFLARQQELNTLSDLQPSRRRDHLAGLLGIERLDKGIIRLKEDLRFEAGQIDFMERQLAERTGLSERIEELTTRLGELNAREGSVTDAVHRAETMVRKTTDLFASEQARKSDWVQITARLTAESGTQALLEQQSSQLKNELSELLSLTSEKDQLDELIKSLAPIRAEFERMRETRSRSELRRQLQQQLEHSHREKQQVETALGNCQSELDSLSHTLEAIPDDVAQLLDQAHGELEQARSRYSHLKAERDSLARQIEKLNQQIQSVDKFGPESVCDRCHRPLGKDLPEIRQHLTDELNDLEKSASELDLHLKQQSDLGKQLKGRWTELEQMCKTRYQLRVDKVAADKELSSLQDKDRAITASIEELTEKLAASSAVAFDQSEFDRLEQRLDELESAQARRQLLQGKLSRLPLVQVEIEALDSKMKKVAEGIESLSSRLSELAYDAKAFDQAQLELTSVQHRLEEARNEQFSFSKEVEITRAELDEKLRQKEDLRKAEDELEEHRTSRYHREKLGVLFADFRKDLIARIRPRLAELSSRLFADMTGGKYSLVELDSKYNLRVMDGGEFFGVERFSGGEKDLANLCLRLAISQALTESAGLDRSFVILDEVFGSQDDERKDLIISALGGLKNQFPQILLITHVDDIRDRVEDLIEVRPTGAGYSEVKFNGNATA